MSGLGAEHHGLLHLRHRPVDDTEPQRAHNRPRHQRQAQDSAAVLSGLSGAARHRQRVRDDPARLAAAQLWRRYPDESARPVLALLSVAKAQSRVVQVRVPVHESRAQEAGVVSAEDRGPARLSCEQGDDYLHGCRGRQLFAAFDGSRAQDLDHSVEGGKYQLAQVCHQYD